MLALTYYLFLKENTEALNTEFGRNALPIFDDSQLLFLRRFIALSVIHYERKAQAK